MRYDENLEKLNELISRDPDPGLKLVSWEPGSKRGELMVRDELNEDVLERLASLGYII